MKLRGMDERLCVCRVASRVKNKRKLTFSFIFMLEYWVVSEIRVHTPSCQFLHVYIFISNPSAKGVYSVWRKDYGLPLPET